MANVTHGFGSNGKWLKPKLDRNPKMEMRNTSIYVETENPNVKHTILIVSEDGRQFQCDPALTSEVDRFAAAMTVSRGEALRSILSVMDLNNAVVVVSQNFADLSLLKLRSKLNRRAFKVLESPYQPKPIKAKVKSRRNGPCPCGSGLKFKHCCMH